MRSNIHLKNRAISLRREGYSYNDIIKLLGIKSKGTLSNWFKNLKLSGESIALLERNNELARARGLFTANKNRTDKISKENKEAFESGKNSINLLSSNDILIIGASLYWAEGMKSERNIPSLTFSNSDPLMVSVYMRFIREILKIPEEKIRAGIHIYPSISEDAARKFWAEITHLPYERFYIITQVSRASQNKRPLNILPHGTVAIKVNNRQQFYKVKGMIHGIIEKLT